MNAKKNQRRKGALERLEKQLASGKRTVKVDGHEVTRPLEENEVMAMRIEISKLQGRISSV